MAIVEPQAALVPTPSPITSVQPGGGLCMSIELAWGSLRRAGLRRFWPDYVRQMAEKRQGTCPNCPHEIVDPRDLKFYRNVCGYSFRPEDDAFLWRNEFGLARMGLGEIIIFSFGFMGLVVLLAILAVYAACVALPLLVAVAMLWLGVLYFFRDPDRHPSTDPTALLSPADGTITDIGEVAEPEFPGGRAFRIGMFLSVVNVHVNRIPRSGRVVNLRYFPGTFLDARHPDVTARNEQMWIDLEEAGTGRKLRVKQIAGKIARRIVCWLKVGEQVTAGERLGMIKFGSRTEIYLPLNTPMEVEVTVGSRVQGGSTVLLRLKDRKRSADG